jgi:hypothetical protein
VRTTVRAVLVLLLVSSPAIGAIEYSGQSRQVTTLAGLVGGAGESDLDSTTATGVWSGSADCAFGTDPPTCSAAAVALQTLNLGDLEISMTGELAAATAGIPFSGCEGTALSQLVASFTLDSDVAYVSELDTPKLNSACWAPVATCRTTRIAAASCQQVTIRYRYCSA